jgi:hypothetical protein
MKIAYLILAHTNPQIIERAIASLSFDDCAFFIHVDKKSRIEDFLHIVAENVFLLENRVPVYWGYFSQVEAILVLLRQAMTEPCNYDYFVLLSGSDYPLRSGKYIDGFFRDNYGLEFLSSVQLPNKAAGKPLSYFNKLVFPPTQPIRRFAARGLGKLGLAQRDYRRYLGDLEPYAGSTWWALTRDACAYCLEFVQSHPEVTDFFRNMPAADEAFFQTILGNSEFQSQVRRNLVYDDWSARELHPAMINEMHVALFEAQEKVCLNDVYGPGERLFVRKVPGDNMGLLDRIDRMIVRKDKAVFG